MKKTSQSDNQLTVNISLFYFVSYFAEVEITTTFAQRFTFNKHEVIRWIVDKICGHPKMT